MKTNLYTELRDGPFKVQTGHSIFLLYMYMCMYLQCMYVYYHFQGNNGDKFLEKLWCCIGRERYKVNWLYQLESSC